MFRTSLRSARARHSLAALLATTLLCGATELVAQPAIPEATDDSPHLDYNQEIRCLALDDGTELRFQCDNDKPTKPVCYVARSRTSGNEELDRARYCSSYFDAAAYAELAATHQIVAAIAEAPPGWARDENGRVFQVSFDMLNRFFMGAGWYPTVDVLDGGSDLERVRFELGFSGSFYDPYERSRHEIKAIEGSVALGELELDGRLFAYEYSHDARAPALRIVSFFGAPARFDFNADIGFGLSLLSVRSRLDWEPAVSDVEFFETHIAWDLYQSRDLYDRLRFWFGVGVGALWQDDLPDEAIYLSPQGGLEARFALDRAGMHHLFGDLRYVSHVYLDDANLGAYRNTGSAKLAWEWILLSINDQPLSLYTEAALALWEGVDGDRLLDSRFLTGLRFSLWAPGKMTDEEFKAGGYY